MRPTRHSRETKLKVKCLEKLAFSFSIKGPIVGIKVRLIGRKMEYNKTVYRVAVCEVPKSQVNGLHLIDKEFGRFAKEVL